MISQLRLLRIIGEMIAAVMTTTSRVGTTTMGRSSPSAGGMRITAAAGTKTRVRVMIGAGITIITSRRTIATAGERTRAAVVALGIAGTTTSSPRITGGAMIIAHGTGTMITTGAVRRTVIMAAKPSGVTMKPGTETVVVIATAANGPTSAIVRMTVASITATSVSQVRRPRSTIIIGSLIIIISGRTITRATTNATITVSKEIIMRKTMAAMDTPIRIIITSLRSKNATITTVQL